MRTLTTALILPLLLSGLCQAQESQKDLSPQERQAILDRFDRNHDGEISDTEKANAMKHLDQDGDGKITGKEADKTRAKARSLLLKNWWKVVGDLDHTMAKGANDEAQVKTTHTINCGATHRAYLMLHWGDLENGIQKGGKQNYSNWDGTLTVKNGTAKIVTEFAFEDDRHREPKAGSGADKIVNDHDPAKVTWKAGVVGATDGLLIEVNLVAATGSVILTLGGSSLPIVLTPLATGTVLPNGRTIE